VSPQEGDHVERGRPLAGRAAVVTGASRRAGIGFAVAKRLLADGARVLVQSWTAHDEAQPWGADPAGIEGVLADLEAGGGNVEHLEADFAEDEAPARVISAATASFGHVDILVVNHARSGSGTLDELTATELDAFLHENVRASMLLVREFAAQHDGRPGGRVILMTSGQHLGAMPGEVAYAVSKGALHQATATLSATLIVRGITVSTVNPGPTDTGWGLGEMPPAPAMPLGRWGEPDDAARLIAWLCSDDARWITGQVIDSEGGFRR
jgi:NAD(P)-dependent dehydrogenase (short-subunit alcohol dehydrogenase family)